jgi:hypothetical protein
MSVYDQDNYCPRCGLRHHECECCDFIQHDLSIARVGNCPVCREGRTDEPRQANSMNDIDPDSVECCDGVCLDCMPTEDWDLWDRRLTSVLGRSK